MQPASEEMPQSVGIQATLTQMHIDDWLRNDVFHPRWWVLLFLLVISVVAWFLLMDKTKARSVCLFAALGGIFSLGIFEYGDELVLWSYPVDIIPIFPPLTSVNLFILPLAYSLIYQRFTAWKSYIPAALAAAAVICFVIEPLLAWGGLYELVNWHYCLSLPLYFAVAVAARFLTVKIEGFAGKSRQISDRPCKNGG